MKKIKLRKTIAFSLIVFLIVVAFVVFKLNSPTDNISIKADQVNSPSTDSSLINDEEKLPKVNLEDLSIPILMYHHIRDYDDPNDQIGVNLSVSPNKLEKHLDIIERKGYETITFEDIENGRIPEKPIILTFDDGYKNFFENAYPLLKARKMKAVVFVIVNYKNNSYLTDEEIIELSLNGFEIGSHTLSHPDLSKISLERASNEIINSNNALKNLLDKDIISFCYPAGKYNEEVIEIVNDHYKFATTTKPGMGDFKTPMELKRLRITNTSNLERSLE